MQNEKNKLLEEVWILMAERREIQVQNGMFFLLGEHSENAGPFNVNAALIRNCDESLSFQKYEKGIVKVFEIVYKILKCKVVILSGICSHRLFALVKAVAKITNRNMIYLMHGCNEYENKVNNLNMMQAQIDTERKIWDYADLILCVSEKYAEWFKQYKPQYAQKIKFLNNGIEICPRSKVKKKIHSIALAGGNRNIKNNGLVCQAVQILHNRDIKCSVEVFGRIYDDNEDILKYPFVHYNGQLPKEKYYDLLDSVDLFVIASELEPFGLVIADAVNCNCSLLLSKNVGGASILKMEPCDIIADPHNIGLMADQIQYLFDHPNAERLLKSIDRENCSEQSAYQKLIAQCLTLLENG